MSRKGFRLEIQKDLTPDEREVAEEMCMEFATSRWSDNWATGEGPNSLRRKVIGCCKPYNNPKLLFRRISNGRRIFGVVRSDTVITDDGVLVSERSGCFCDSCTGGIKARFVNRPEMEFFYERGDIKG
jgi:hypothetical protein